MCEPCQLCRSMRTYCMRQTRSTITAGATPATRSPSTVLPIATMFRDWSYISLCILRLPAIIFASLRLCVCDVTCEQSGARRNYRVSRAAFRYTARGRNGLT